MAHLSLYGPVTLHAGSTAVVVGGRPAQILALLALGRGAPVSAEGLIDRLWPEAPSSGLNALQRHISTLRRTIRSVSDRLAGVEVVVHQHGSYRLDGATMTTDLDLLDDPGHRLVGPPADNGQVVARWWLEPLMGLPYESFANMRFTLDHLAIQAAHQWMATEGADAPADQVVEALSSLADRHPYDDGLLRSLDDAIQGRRGARDAGPPQRVDDATADDHSGVALAVDSDQLRHRFAGLSESIVRWLAADVSGAQAQLEKSRSAMRPDTADRAARWFANLDPADGLARSLLTELVSIGRIDPVDGERLLVSVDAYALAQLSDGLDRARAELAAAPTSEQSLRCLRVLCFSLLASPMDGGFVEFNQQLADLDDLEAQAEAGRFEIGRLIRYGHFAEALDRLPSVEWKLRSLGGDPEWFSRRVRFAVHAHESTRHLVPELNTEDLLPNGADDRAVVNAGTLWHRLSRGDASGVTAAQLRQVANEFSADTTVAFEALHLLAISQPRDAANAIGSYRGRLTSLPRHHWCHLLPVVAGRVAATVGDRDLADEAARAIEPWSGEWLGNFDIVIEQADRFLQSMAEV